MMKPSTLILIILVAFFGNPFPTNAQQWVPVLSGVLIKEFVVSPAYSVDGVIYSIYENHGLYRSVNRGLDWEKVYEPADPIDPSEWIIDIVISPDFSNTNTLLLVKGSGEIKQSTNRGDDWNLLPTPGNESVKALAFSANYMLDHTIFCWTFNGAARFWRTTDPNISWNFVSELLIPFEFDILKSAGGGIGSQALFSGVKPGAHFLRSLDEGVAWSNAAGWPSSDGLNNYSCSPGFNNDSTIFSTVYLEGAGEGNVMKSVHGGLAWNVCHSIGDNIEGLSLSPSYSSNGKLIIGTNQSGVFISNNGGGTWTAMNDGLTNPHVLAVTISADDPLEVFASTYNIGALPDKIWKFTTTSSIEKKISGEQFNIFPNPANDKFEIIINKTEFEVNVKNMYGEVLLKQINSRSINIHMLPCGTYIIEIKADESIGRKKLIVYR